MAPANTGEQPRRYRITAIFIDPDVCTCSQLCVDECPEVLDGNTASGVPKVKDGAEALFDLKAKEIESAVWVCPVDAIRLTKQAI
jgi:ferredoxin